MIFSLDLVGSWVNNKSKHMEQLLSDNFVK